MCLLLIHAIYSATVHRVPLDGLHEIHGTIYVRVVPSSYLSHTPQSAAGVSLWKRRIVFSVSSVDTCSLPNHSSSCTSRCPSWNSRHHLRTCCTIIISLPYTSIGWRCISMGETFFAHKNWITLCGMQLKEHAIGSSIVTVLLHPVLPTTRYEKNQCCPFNPINIL